MKTILLVLAMALFLAGAVAGTQAPKPWKSECFGTLDAMVGKINALGDRAQSAHVVTVPSTRNVGGWLGQPYCLVYQP